MKHKLLLKGFLTLAILICAQVHRLGAQQQPARDAGGCDFAVEPGVDGDSSYSRTAPGDDHAGAQLRDYARRDV